ncbi:MAG: hypothetical protein IKV79_00390 [Oscillospiraceae bacterium]|nr:hypothetical protein [Oscillospiraceae bacterium]
MIISLLLCSCGERDSLEKHLHEARARWEEGKTIRFTAELCAELSQEVFTCRLNCLHEKGETIIEIIEPENLAGIKVRMKDGETALEFDGIILAIENPMMGESSPLGAMGLFMDALRCGFINQMWMERENEQALAVYEMYVDDNTSAKLWFWEENFALMNAELVRNGRSVVKCKITDFAEE